MYRCRLSGVSDSEKNIKSTEPLKGGEKGVNLLAAQPTSQEVLFSTLLLGTSVPTDPVHFCWVNGNPQKNHGPGLLILTRLLLLLQSPGKMSLSKLVKTDAPGGLRRPAPSAPCKPDLQWQKPLEKQWWWWGGTGVRKEGKQSVTQYAPAQLLEIPLTGFQNEIEVTGRRLL